MRALITLVLGIVLAANGLFMLGLPADWYVTVPGVIDTGPFNPHFVRDIGAAYLVAGAAFICLARSRAALPAALAAAAFLAIHALVHLWDAAAGREHVHQLLVDVPGVFLPPALAIWIVGSPLRWRLVLNKGETS
jgi:uncharacterized protein YjeT (DUF2065 family)